MKKIIVRFKKWLKKFKASPTSFKVSENGRRWFGIKFTKKF